MLALDSRGRRASRAHEEMDRGESLDERDEGQISLSLSPCLENHVPLVFLRATLVEDPDGRAGAERGWITSFGRTGRRSLERASF